MSSTKPNMSNDQLNNIAQFLLQGQSNGKPAVGRINETAAVDSSFKTLSHVALNKVFLTLQGVMVEIMKVRGHNNYTVPHMKKDALMRLNILPTDLEVEINLVRNCIEDLIEGGEAEGLGELMGSLGYI
ncbi:hypothetical protein OROHE_026200 [Orobanche hederae]